MIAIGDPAPSGDMIKLKADEARAREVFGPHFDGELVAYWPDPPDFVLCRDAVVVGWAEATSAADGMMRALSDRMSKDGTTYTSESLAYDWVVSFAKDAMFKNLDREHLVELLLRHEAILERDTLSQPNRRFRIQLALEDIRDDRKIDAAFKTYGIDYVYPLVSTKGRRTVYLEQPGMTFMVAPNLIVELAEEKAQAKADSLKGFAGEGHLLIGVDTTWPSGAAFALSDTDLPDGPADLPDPITDVWMSSVTTLIWHFSKANRSWEAIVSGT